MSNTNPNQADEESPAGTNTPTADDNPFAKFRDAGPMDPAFEEDWDRRVAHGTPG